MITGSQREAASMSSTMLKESTEKTSVAFSDEEVVCRDTKRIKENENEIVKGSLQMMRIPQLRVYDVDTSGEFSLKLHHIKFTISKRKPRSLHKYLILEPFSFITDAVREHYKDMRKKQTIKHVTHCAEKYNLMKTKMSPWAVELMETFVDISDPDINLPQVTHLLQTAESIRAEGLPDWFQLVGFIHDLGKMMYLKGCDADGSSLQSQWSIVGDTFVIGAPLPATLVYPEFNALNHDNDLDVYPDGVGLTNVHIAYGHDEYLYQVLAQAQGVTLPAEALFAIRFHSLYPWHTHGEYSRLEDSTDRALKNWVLLLNQHDLYSKDKAGYTDTKKQELLCYYRGLVEKYLPAELLW
jgi:inositol oxygenase